MANKLFCSECGTQYIVASWPRNCNQCGYIEWANPIPVSSIIQPISNGSQTGILLLKRAIDPHLGGWSIPGGFMEDNGESAEDAAIRELYEETNIQLFLKPKIVSSSGTTFGQLIIICESAEILPIEDLDIKLCNENSEYRIAYEFEELTFPIQTKAVKEWFENY